MYPGGTDSVDSASVVAMSPDGTVLGEATVSRLYGARGELILELSPRERLKLPTADEVALALVEAIERAAVARGLMRLELDARTIDHTAVIVLLEHAHRRDTQLQLSWPTTTR